MRFLFLAGTLADLAVEGVAQVEALPIMVVMCMGVILFTASEEAAAADEVTLEIPEALAIRVVPQAQLQLTLCL
jgi:hypothetical protein